MGIPSQYRLGLVLVAFLLISSLAAGSALDGRLISAFVIGHSGYVWYNPFRVLFSRDPQFRYNLYPLPPDLPDSDKRKLDRVYFPRTRRLLVESYDLMVFHDARIQHLLGLHLRMDGGYLYGHGGRGVSVDPHGSKEGVPGGRRD